MASQDWIEKDFYKILGVSKDVTQAELKKAYRKLAKDNHPDLHPGDAKAEARFKDISEAYDVLSDPEQRKEYDAIRAMGGGARFTAGGQGGFDGCGGPSLAQSWNDWVHVSVVPSVKVSVMSCESWSPLDAAPAR